MQTILAPHASLALSVSFTPPQEASYSGSLTVTTLSRVETNGKRQQVAREITSHYSFPLMGSEQAIQNGFYLYLPRYRNFELAAEFAVHLTGIRPINAGSQVDGRIGLR